MNIDDKEILDRIERLAFQAGVGSKCNVAEPKPEVVAKPVPHEVRQVLRYFDALCGSGAHSDDVCHYIFNDNISLTYGQVRKAVEWIKAQHDCKFVEP